MKNFVRIIFLLILCAALPLVIPADAQSLDLNFGPVTVSSSSGYKPAIDAVTSPMCHDSSDTCNATEKVDELRNAFAKNKLVPEGEWLNNKLSEIRKEIISSGCRNYSMEVTMNSIVTDHVDYCKTTANPHVGDLDILTKSWEDFKNGVASPFRSFDKLYFKLVNKEINEETLDYIYDKTIQNNNIEYAYLHNCNATALSYAMCRQGYDVQAHAKKGEHYDMNQTGRLVQVLQPDCWGPSEDETFLESIEEKMDEWPNGTIIYINVQWKKQKSGHSITAEKINGEIVFIDPQDPTRSSDYLRKRLINDIDELDNSFFFRTNDIYFGDKLDLLTEWVDKPEVVEQTKY